MVEISRRSFLGGLIAVAAAATVVKFDAAAHAAIPHIYGDGIHDDTEGLRAAIEGKPFTCDGCVVRPWGNRVIIGRGTFRISSTIPVDGKADVRVDFRGSDFVAAKPWKGRPGSGIFDVSNANVTFDGCCFDASGLVPGEPGPSAAINFRNSSVVMAGEYP